MRTPRISSKINSEILFTPPRRATTCACQDYTEVAGEEGFGKIVKLVDYFLRNIGGGMRHGLPDCTHIDTANLFRGELARWIAGIGEML